MAHPLLADVLRLPADERMQLVEDICASIEANSRPLVLTDAQRAELDRRLADYHLHPDQGVAWEKVRAELLGGD